MNKPSLPSPVKGRDVSNGTFRIDAVRQSFYRAARQLEALARGRSIHETSINYLSALFDVQRTLKRRDTYEDPFYKVGDLTMKQLEVFGKGSFTKMFEL